MVTMCLKTLEMRAPTLGKSIICINSVCVFQKLASRHALCFTAQLG